MSPPALMEYHVCKATNVATRIFEKGIELFGNEEIEIVLRYLGFLISLNDDASELPFSVVLPVTKTSTQMLAHSLSGSL
jgi:hypothetical protein